MNWICNLSNSIRIITEVSEPTNEQIAEYCDLFTKELNTLKKCANRMNHERLIDSIDETLDHFDFCKAFCTGEITKEEYADYDFDGNIKNLFNDYVREFWEICDYQIAINCKFCFVRF
jgi:hypothetical protein